jgi:hypothetical protein
MSRTSTALKRLGVAGLATVTIGAGFPALLGSPASAVPNADEVTLSPNADTAAVGTCNAFTITIEPEADGAEIIDVQLSQTAAEDSTDPLVIGFCDPESEDDDFDQATPNDRDAGAGFDTVDADSDGGGGGGLTTEENGAGDESCTTTPPAGGFTGDEELTCHAEFTVQDEDDTVTFGVRSSEEGEMLVEAWDDENGDDIRQVGEEGDDSVKTWSDRDADDLNCEPETATRQVDPGVGGDDDIEYTCTLKNEDGFTIAGEDVYWEVIEGPDEGEQDLCGTTDNTGVVECTIEPNDGDIGTDEILFYVDENGNSTPQTTEAQDEVLATFVGEARNIVCTPDTQTRTVTTVATITCVVTDADGNEVEDQTVRFEETGSGVIRGDQYKETDENGVVVVETITNSEEVGTQTVTATLYDAPFGDPLEEQTDAECESAANETESNLDPEPTTAGNCDDTSTVNWLTNASASPTATATATPTATQTASPTTPAGCTTARQNLPFTINDPNKTVVATAPVTVTVTGAQPGATVELEAYQQNHYGTANFGNAANTRTAVADSNGAATFTLRFSSNARMRAKQAGCAFGANAGFNNPGGNILFVSAAIFMNVERVGTRTYRITGDSIPARPGGMIINIYCNDSRCKSPNNPTGIIRQPRANATTGEYTATNYTFPASFRNTRVNVQALVRGDAQNVSGGSNVRSLLVN